MKATSNIFHPFAVRRNMKWLLIFFCCSLTYNSCINPPNFSDIPFIEFKSVNKTQINQQTDSLKVVFSFTDGDGDLGVDQNDTSSNTYITDIRNGKKPYTYQYRLPYISSRGMVKDISGEITITLPGVTCIPGKTLDIVTYQIQIKDRAGHRSNIINSPPIMVNCQ